MSIQISKSADKNSVVSMDIINYTINIVNTETTPIFNIKITDNIPQCTTLVANSVTLNCNLIPDGDLITGIKIPTLQPGSSAIVGFKVQVMENCYICKIENTASIVYTFNQNEYTQSSNTVIISKDCTQNSCSSLGKNYIIPGPGGITEAVIMTDKSFSCGIMAIPGNTLAISRDAIKLLYEAFFTQYPATVNNLNPTNDYDISNLLVALNNAGIISFTQNPPPKDELIEYTVAIGDTINRPPASCPCCIILEPIPAQYQGRVICVKIGPFRVYIYLSNELVSNINCGSGCTSGYNAISTEGPFGFTVYPQPISGALGSNCGACGVCGVCGGCALCGPSAILGAASAAALSVIAISSSLSAFPSNMGEN